MKIILMFCEPRSGSNVLCESMIMWDPMLVMWDFFAPFPPGFSTNNKTKDLEFDALADAYLTKDELEITNCLQTSPRDGLLSLLRRSGKNIVIKIHSWHLRELTLDSLFLIPETEVIILERRDVLKQYVSYIKAGKIGQWRYADTSDIKVEVDPYAYRLFVHETSAWYQKVRQSCDQHGKNRLELTYEDCLEMISTSQDPLISRIEPWFSSVGITATRNGYTPNRLKKQDLSKPEISITNWKDLEPTQQ